MCDTRREGSDAVDVRESRPGKGNLRQLPVVILARNSFGHLLERRRIDHTRDDHRFSGEIYAMKAMCRVSNVPFDDPMGRRPGRARDLVPAEYAIVGFPPRW